MKGTIRVKATIVANLLLLGAAVYLFGYNGGVIVSLAFLLGVYVTVRTS